jgi:hypothetical protein
MAADEAAITKHATGLLEGASAFFFSGTGWGRRRPSGRHDGHWASTREREKTRPAPTFACGRDPPQHHAPLPVPRPQRAQAPIVPCCRVGSLGWAANRRPVPSFSHAPPPITNLLSPPTLPKTQQPLKPACRMSRPCGPWWTPARARTGTPPSCPPPCPRPWRPWRPRPWTWTRRRPRRPCARRSSTCWAACRRRRRCARTRTRCVARAWPCSGPATPRTWRRRRPGRRWTCTRRSARRSR